MILTNGLIELYKSNPAKFDFDKGYNQAGIDFWCGGLTIFGESHSRAFRDGYVRGYVCAMDAEESLTTSYGKAVEITMRAFDAKATVKYDEAPETTAASWADVLYEVNKR